MPFASTLSLSRERVFVLTSLLLMAGNHGKSEHKQEKEVKKATAALVIV
jgi:hypothetical protein